tara:strand:+ start:2400 stop:2906 length:507 start_codon:yes stop_codon:yes gene_type:complete
MKIKVKSLNIQEAFNNIGDAIENIDPAEWPQDIDRFIDLDTYEDLDLDRIIKKVQGTGILFGYKSEELGKNTGKVKSLTTKSKIELPFNWQSSYMAVWDTPKGVNVIKGSKSKDLAATTKIAKEATENTGRSSFVIVGAYPVGQPRLCASIEYKPSANTKLAEFTFIW